MLGIGDVVLLSKQKKAQMLGKHWWRCCFAEQEEEFTILYTYDISL